MSLNMLIKEIVRNELSSYKIYTQPCVVQSVDSTARTCLLSPVNGDADRTGWIQASLELTEGIYIVPVVGSNVMLTFNNEIKGIITKYSEIDYIEIKPQTKLTLKQGNEQIDDVFEKLRAIQDDINDLKQVIGTTWTPVPNDGGAALKTAAATWYGTNLIIVQ